MSHIVDMMSFPSTPEEMEWLLKLEDNAKRDGGLTHRGLIGYMVVSRPALWRHEVVVR